MIYEVTGDILLTKAQAIAHGVAPNDHFNQGLALHLREMAPAMYKDFRHYYQTHHPKEGTIWVWSGADGRRIVNLLTQVSAKDHDSHPGKATLSNIASALKELRKWVEKEEVRSLSLPRLATGVGGQQWSDVKPLIEKHLGDLKIPVYVYTVYQKGVKAQEP
ncbi:MAG: hypothetical protein N2578_05000 [Bdellovibrionaceae bacterium]|nr:hypothetical protein [Pseudobdellovibrionaceae bacterium]